MIENNNDLQLMYNSYIVCFGNKCFKGFAAELLWLCSQFCHQITSKTVHHFY